MTTPPLHFRPGRRTAPSAALLSLVPILAALAMLLASCSGGSDPAAPPGGDPVAPTADFSAATRLGVSPLSVQFQDESAAGTSAITAWSWNFGDGSTSSERHPAHVYAQDSTYDVSLRVTSAAGTHEKTTADYVESYSLRVVDGQIDAVPGQSPAIPLPDSYSQILGANSEQMFIAQATVREFKPVVSEALITMWAGDSEAVVDCPGYFVLPEPVGATPLWRTGVPRRNTTDRFLWLFYTANETWPGTFPARFTVWTTTYGFAGGTARWSSCEERGSFLDEWTSHEISYNVPAQSVPVIRHYTKWVKAVDVPIGESGGTSQSYSVAWGVTSTIAYEFTASITSEVGVEVDGFSANLSTTLSQTFSSSHSVETRTEVVRSYTSGTPRPGYEQRFYLWQLVDVYQVEGNVPGELWSDPSFHLQNPSRELSIEAPQDNYAVVSVWFRR